MAIYRLAIDPNQVTGTHASGFVQLVTGDCIPADSSIWDTAVNGGGDLRAYSNALGTISLPLEVVSFDTIAKTCILWIRHTSQVDDTTGGECWIEATGSGTQPPVTDPAGRNDVWQDWEFRSHDCLTDSAGNHSLNLSWTPNASTGPFSDDGGLYFNGGNRWINVSTSTPMSDSARFTAWVRPDTNLSNPATISNIVGLFNSSSPDNYLSLSHHYGGASFASHDDSAVVWPRTTAYPADDAAETSIGDETLRFRKIDATITESERKVWLDGANKGTNSNSTSFPSTANLLVIGRYGDSSPSGYFRGWEAEVGWQSTIPSDDYVTTESNNQLDPAAFAQLEELVPSEGVDSSISLSLDSLGFAATSTVTLPTPVSAASLQLDGLSFAATSNVTLPTPVSAATLQLDELGFTAYAGGTLPTPVSSATLQLDSLAFSVAADTTQSTPLASIGFSIGELGFDAESAVTLPDVSSSVTMSLGELRFTAVVGEVVASKKYTFSLTPRKLSGALTTRKI